MASKHSAIEIQISARVSAPRNGRPITDKIIRQAIVRRTETHEEIPGIELRIIRWRHGTGRFKHGSEADWDYFARFLPATPIIVHQIRKARSR